MSITASIWREAPGLPLNDAAFQFWRYKHRFDEEEFGAPKFVAVAKADEQAHMRSVMARIRHEHDFAHEGPTFDRLKRAHPAARDDDLRDAIKAAVRMMDACERYFESGWTDFGAAIDTALAKAKAENPGFREDTWRDAGNWLVYVMK